MLKIKDDVDLKELEKFGFEITKNMWLPRYTRNYVEIYYNLPEKWKTVKTDNVRKKLGLHLIHERSIIFNPEVPEEYRESLIHDLIRAGLVEKE